jgi:hypothetical protein
VVKDNPTCSNPCQSPNLKRIFVAGFVFFSMTKAFPFPSQSTSTPGPPINGTPSSSTGTLFLPTRASQLSHANRLACRISAVSGVPSSLFQTTGSVRLYIECGALRWIFRSDWSRRCSAWARRDKVGPRRAFDRSGEDSALRR